MIISAIKKLYLIKILCIVNRYYRDFLELKIFDMFCFKLINIENIRKRGYLVLNFW